MASLQYVLEDHLKGFRDEIFAGGVEAIDNLMERLNDGEAGLEAELKRIRTQEQLDAMGEASEEELDRFEVLEGVDLGHEAFQEGFDSWVSARLQFERMPEEQGGKTARYRYVLSRGRQTLVPPDTFVRWCGASVDSESGDHARATRPIAFSRFQCLRRRAELARVGHPFVDGLVELTRRDDRGVAHAMWRLRRGLRLPLDPWLIFGFDYLVEADPEVAVASEEFAPGSGSLAVRRRLDQMLPPRYATVWLDQELEPVEDPRLLALLGEPYDDRRIGGKGDWNLSPARWEIVRPVLHVGSWEELCFEAADKAMATMKERLKLDEEVRRAEQRVDEYFELVRGQMQARLSALRGPGTDAERRVLAMEEALAEGARRAIRNPRISPDSAFAVFLSTFDLFAESD